MPDVVGALPEGFQFDAVAQLPLPPLPVHDVRVAAEAKEGETAGETRHSIAAMSVRLREHRLDTAYGPKARNIKNAPIFKWSATQSSAAQFGETVRPTDGSPRPSQSETQELSEL